MRICILLFVLVVCIPLESYSQGRYGLALADTHLDCISSLDGVLYSGIDNYLRVDSSLFKECDEIMLTTSNGPVLKDTNDLYLVIPGKAGKLRISLVCTDSAGKEKIAGYRLFDVRNLPEPQLTLDSVPIANPSYIAKSTLINCDSLGVYFSEYLAGSAEWLRITEFQLGYTYGGFHVSHTNLTNQITEETRNILNQLGPDHEISIRARVTAMGNIQKQLPIYRIRIY